MRLDKSVLTIADLDSNDEIQYWKVRTSEERFAAIETNRKIVYGYGNHPPRLQRILEIIEPSQN